MLKYKTRSYVQVIMQLAGPRTKDIKIKDKNI